eukprot:1069612_1
MVLKESHSNKHQFPTSLFITRTKTNYTLSACWKRRWSLQKVKTSPVDPIYYMYRSNLYVLRHHTLVRCDDNGDIPVYVYLIRISHSHSYFGPTMPRHYLRPP